MTDNDLVRRVDAALKESVPWDLIDEVLLGLCKARPSHQHKNEVIAKVALIGRTYSTGVERAFKGGSSMGDALTSIVDHMYSKRKTVDKIIDSIPGDTDRLTEEAIIPIVCGHSRFLNLLSECDECHRDPRSFVSKYLHFHRPIVPIFDSYAASVISRVVGGRTRINRRYPVGVKLDDYYCPYVEKFWRIYQRIRDAGRDCTVKEVDTYLLWEAHR